MFKFSLPEAGNEKNVNKSDITKAASSIEA